MRAVVLVLYVQSINAILATPVLASKRTSKNGSLLKI